jgi:hypothetical protein
MEINVFGKENTGKTYWWMGRNIKKSERNKICLRGLDKCVVGYKQVPGCFEYCNEISGSVI